MKVPFSWLKDYVDIDVTAEELQEKLFSCGFEVEELVKLGHGIEKVVVGLIAKCEKHPDADRLTVCTVDCGSYGVKQICTAATNVFEGAKVPCALDGATVLHEGGIQKIKTGKLRGVASEGMFCSGEELGINGDFYDGADVYGILILEDTAPLGEDVKKVVGLDDYVFDISVTANRPDCQSVFGIAREVAAILKKPLKLPATNYTKTPTHVSIPVEVKEPALCPRYIGHYVADVKIGKSPLWMRRRLALCDIRSISDMVDITNFVLLELGQPMHAFDRNFLRGSKIVVRCAEEGEKIVTLDEKEFTLHRNNLLICDGEGGVALAGIMGGLNSEIKDTTQAVFFEAAKFARDSVRKTSRALGQHSDSSARFEKGVDAWTPEFAMDRALHLVEELGCGKPTTYRADACAEQPQAEKITASLKKINGLLGIKVPKKEAVAILERLGFQPEVKGDALSVTVPLWRQDIEGWPDLAEEIIRSYGYGHIKPTFLQKATVTHGGLTHAQTQELKFKNVLRSEGYLEACNFSFYSPKDFDLLRLPVDAPERDAIRILNPIGEDLSVMRTILAPSMLGNIVRNVRRGNESGRLFELANVYNWAATDAECLFVHTQSKDNIQPVESKRAVLGLWGEGDFFDLKGAVEAIAEAFGLKLTYKRGGVSYLHPGVTADVYLGEKKAGVIGELHPAIAAELALEKKAYLAELDYELLSGKFAQDITYRHLPKFPRVERDLAVVVDEKTTCAEIEACILRACKAAKSAEQFDIYRDKERLGEGKKSMAFHIVFEADENAEKQLSPETVDGFFNKIVGNLKYNLGAELR